MKKKERHTKDINNSLFFNLFISTGNEVRDTGTTSMSEALKLNTTLTALYLSCEDKRKEDTQKTSINKSLFSILITSTGNDIGDTGAKSLSEALKSNTTLAALNLRSEYKRKKTHKRHP